MFRMQKTIKLSTFRVIKCLRVVFIIIFLSGCTPIPDHSFNIPCQAPKPKPLKNIRVALVLGTGGFRSIAQLGVLEVLEKEGIPIDLIVGSSAGSLIGAVYCDKPHIDLIKNEILHIKKENFLESGQRPIAGTAMLNFVTQNLSAKNFEELKIPLIVVATNLDTNEIELLRSGPIAPAVLASSADPLIFKPVSLYGQTLIDGAILDPVPVDVACLFKPKMIIAVNVGSRPPTTPIKNKKDLLSRCIDISFYKYSMCHAKEADINLHPCFYNFDTYNDQHNQEIYEHGKKCAYAAIADIKHKMKELGL